MYDTIQYIVYWKAAFLHYDVMLCSLTLNIICMVDYASGHWGMVLSQTKTKTKKTLEEFGARQEVSMSDLNFILKRMCIYSHMCRSGTAICTSGILSDHELYSSSTRKLPGRLPMVGLTIPVLCMYVSLPCECGKLPHCRWNSCSYGDQVWRTHLPKVTVTE